MSTVAELSAAINAELAAQPEPAPALRVVPIPEPGIYRDMPMADYLALPLMSASGLDLLRRSPLQYQHARTAPPDDTDATALGTALHCAVLEPELFARHYVASGPCVQLLKTGDRKGLPCGNPGTALHQESGWLCGVHAKGDVAAVITGLHILTAFDFAAVVAMREAILRHPLANFIFDGECHREVTLIFKDSETGVLGKARPDLLAGNGILVDFKTTRDAAPWSFTRDADKLGYFRKFAWYRRALRALDWPYTCSAVVAPETAAPFDLVYYHVDETELDAEDREIDGLLRLYRTCQESGVWPGYADDFVFLTRPWRRKNGD